MNGSVKLLEGDNREIGNPYKLLWMVYVRENFDTPASRTMAVILLLCVIRFTDRLFSHGYGVYAVTKGVPLNMLSKWMGHSSLEIPAIYANALGEEQGSIEARLWS